MLPNEQGDDKVAENEAAKDHSEVNICKSNDSEIAKLVEGVLVIPPTKTVVLTRGKKRKVAGDNSGEDDEIAKFHQEQLEEMKRKEEQEEERKKELFRRWLHSPERTKKWRNRMKKIEKAEEARETGPLADIWVQCENSDCLKWRRLSKTHSDQLDEEAAWFCHMNPREEFRSCSAPQEDFLEVERLAARLGVKYVSSSLPEGTVVWAKMHGFLRWPGIITRDFAYNSHVFLDADDEPLSYHVEYLGEEHTHNWVGAQRVQLYGTVDEDELLEAATQTPSTKKKKKHTVATVVKSTSKRCFRKNGIQVTHEGAVEEAENLKNLPREDRLKHVVFDRKSFLAMDTNEIVTESDHAEGPQPHSPASMPRGVFQTPTSQSTVPKQSDERSENAACGDHAATPRSPVPSVTGKEAVKRQLNQQVSLLNCTKEERFSLDIQMYARNEKAFEHDVHRFMIRNNRTLGRSPCWQGIQITPFQLFLAVHEQGGYHKVCEKRQWENVFREVTGYQSSKRGMVAKHYYRKNLLPYELYTKNEDYEACLQMTQQKMNSTRGTPIITKSESSCPVPVPDIYENQPSEGRLSEEATEKDLKEIDEMLSQLDYFQDSSSVDRKERDIDITFFDESPPRIQNSFIRPYLGTEFETPSYEPAQEVPDLPEYDDHTLVYTVL